MTKNKKLLTVASVLIGIVICWEAACIGMNLFAFTHDGVEKNTVDDYFTDPLFMDSFKRIPNILALIPVLAVVLHVCSYSKRQTKTKSKHGFFKSLPQNNLDSENTDIPIVLNKK